MPIAIRTYATLELSQAAYDEIEKKLLEAGYEHLFARGPGSAIDMSGLTVVPEQTMAEKRAIIAADMAKHFVGVGSDDTSPVYCFMCDTLVKERCDRENCLHAANERVRADLGLERHP
jgi:hypothetical protein